MPQSFSYSASASWSLKKGLRNIALHKVNEKLTVYNNGKRKRSGTETKDSHEDDVVYLVWLQGHWLLRIPSATLNAEFRQDLQPNSIETRVLVWSQKLNNVESGQYLDGCPLETNRRCKFRWASGKMYNGSRNKMNRH